MSTDSQYYKYNPEKRNIFIEINQSRTNHAREFIISFFMLGASGGSAIVEVFLRKKFGERYITLAQSIGLFFLLNIGYIWLDNLFRFRIDGGGVFMFIFSCAFLVFAIIHRLEISRYGTAYDFKRFSLSDGEIAPFWYKIIGRKIGFIKVNHYLVTVLLEPAIPIIVGVLFTMIPFTRPVGVVLIICGFFFGANNFSKAQQGRNWVLDNIDKKISNEMKYDVFIGRKPKKDTKGIYLPIELPEDEKTRKSLYNLVEDSFGQSDNIWTNDYLDKKDGNREGQGLFDSGNGAGNG